MSDPMTIDQWIEANWPPCTDPNLCRHCNRPDGELLIPVGYGRKPRIWLHQRCYESWRADLRLKAAAATT